LKPLDPAPYYLSYPVKANAGEEVLNTRGERLFQVLTQNKKFTLEEMMKLGFDTYVLPADVIVPLIEKAYANQQGPEESIRAAVEALKNWDRRSHKDSVAFTYLYFWAKAYQELYSAAKFQRFSAYDRAKEVDISSSNEQEMARKAMAESVDRIKKRYGKDQVRWGEINVVVRGGKFPLSGTGELFGVLHPDYGPEQDNGQIYCNDGWGHLLVVMEGEPKEVWSLLPYGESQHPSSPHFNDQAKLHSGQKAKQFWFAPADILRNTESVWGDRTRLERMK
jgi:acyl-homoserine lactone acylase PvdQ